MCPHAGQQDLRSSCLGASGKDCPLLRKPRKFFALSLPSCLRGCHFRTQGLMLPQFCDHKTKIHPNTLSLLCTDIALEWVTSELLVMGEKQIQWSKALLARYSIRCS